MKKRFLTLFTILTILSTFTINVAFAETPSGNSKPSGESKPTESGEKLPPESSGEEVKPTPTPTPSGDVKPKPSGDTTPEIPSESGDVPGEATTITAYDDNLKIDKNTILTASFRAKSKNEKDVLTYIIVERPTHGTVVHTEGQNKDFSYTPNLDYIGEDSFTFKANNGKTDSNIATIKITIEKPKEEIIPFNYTDMQTHWANYSASHLAARGYVIGEQIGKKYYFYPNKEMTRADFMLFLLAITDSPKDSELKIPDITFADSKTTPSWLINAAKIAYAKGIIKGSADGNNIYLNPYKTLTRKEAVVMINNVLKLPDSKDNLLYKDTSSIPNWAMQAVKNLSAYKIIQGNSENKFNPNRIISKAEAAEMCFKMVKQLEIDMKPSTSGDMIK